MLPAPHIGHLYTLVLTDILKRWHALLGRKAILCTGTDEHGMKVSSRIVVAEKEQDLHISIRSSKRRPKQDKMCAHFVTKCLSPLM